MSAKIKPALGAEEWTPVRRLLEGYVMAIPQHFQDSGYVTISVRDRPEAAIALLNAKLPDDDPRKITRETVSILRASARDDEAAYDNHAKLAAIADALESYLPPEGK